MPFFSNEFILLHAAFAFLVIVLILFYFLIKRNNKPYKIIRRRDEERYTWYELHIRYKFLLIPYYRPLVATAKYQDGTESTFVYEFKTDADAIAYYLKNCIKNKKKMKKK